MPEAIIDWSAGYFDKISLFVYVNLEELFQEGKGSRKNTADHESVASTTGVSVPKTTTKKGHFLNTPTLEDVS